MSPGQSRLQLMTSNERRLWLELVQQSARSDRLEAEVSAMHASLSWRLTAPLRVLRAALFRRPTTQPGLTPADSLPKGEVRLGDLPLVWHSLRSRPDDGRVQWFMDVTELSREDLGAGVERVTRRFLSELLLDPPEGARIQPVRLSPDGKYVCANDFLARFLGFPSGTFGADLPLQPRHGDQFIGLDFCRNHAPLLRQALMTLRESGVSISLVVHDVLPLTHPEWFPPDVPAAFEAWLRVLGDVADQALCDSKQTALELGSVLTSRGIRAPALRMEVIALGADFPRAPHIDVLPAHKDEVTRVLTVGTLEPRKGHVQALKAFEALWESGQPFEWVIAGKQGWNVASLIADIQHHPELGRRLFWVNGPDDRELSALYRECDVLLAPSLGEGFGLPIIEAGWHGLPLIVRDLPVFREVAGERAMYFSGTDSDSLARTLLEWLRSGRSSQLEFEGWNSWAQSASRLKELCASGSVAHGEMRS